MIKYCKKHGETEFVLRSDGYERCRKCAVDAVTRRRKKLRIMLIEYKGGKCIHCGYHKFYGALEFHHLDPNEKDFEFTKKQTASWEKLKKEVDKCILLCSNCHREEHERIRILLTDK